MPDLIVCSSQAAQDFLRLSCKVDQSKLELVGDVVPASFFNSDETYGADVQLGFPPDKQVVIYTGSLLPGKGVDLLVEAMEQVLKSRDDTVFALIGYPIEGVRKAVSLGGMQDRVILPGEVDYSDLKKWLAGADLAIDPKPSGSGEASGKVLHYMAAGLAVICFDTENNRAFLGENGFFATAESSADLAAAIDLALTDHEARRKYGAFCRSKAESEFSPDAAGQQLHRLYQQYEE
jgi:glycosyltransferase involved in cell wall biosynthesis